MVAVNCWLTDRQVPVRQAAGSGAWLGRGPAVDPPSAAVFWVVVAVADLVPAADVDMAALLAEPPVAEPPVVEPPVAEVPCPAPSCWLSSAASPLPIPMARISAARPAMIVPRRRALLRRLRQAALDKAAQRWRASLQVGRAMDDAVQHRGVVALAEWRPPERRVCRQ